MTSLADKPVKMTVDEYLLWADKQPERPRHGLVNGVPLAMSPERARHAITKGNIYIALNSAVRTLGLNCSAFPDGMTVKVDEFTAYEPDALVTCGEKISGDEVIIPNPVIITEVLSPGTRHVDAGDRLSGYFQLASVRHYLMVDPVKKLVIHHERGEDRVITTHIVQDGKITMLPPGIEVELAEVFGN